MLEKRITMLRMVARRGSISRAARELGISQPALSREIALLEDTMQTQLLKRSQTGVRPTPAGFFLTSNSFGNLSKRIVEECRQVAAGCLPGLAIDADMLSSILIRPLLTRLAEQHADMPLQLYSYKTYSTLTHLLSGTANGAFILIGQNQPRQRLHTQSLYRTPWLVAARADHEYWELSPVDRGILRDQTVILDRQQMIEAHDVFSDPVSQYCAEYCLSNRDFLHANFLHDQILMLQAGQGVALLPPFMAGELPPEIRLSDELTTPFAPEFALVYRSDNRHPGVMLLQQLCREIFGGDADA